MWVASNPSRLRFLDPQRQRRRQCPCSRCSRPTPPSPQHQHRTHRSSPLPLSRRTIPFIDAWRYYLTFSRRPSRRRHNRRSPSQQTRLLHLHRLHRRRPSAAQAGQEKLPSSSPRRRRRLTPLGLPRPRWTLHCPRNLLGHARELAHARWNAKTCQQPMLLNAFDESTSSRTQQQKLQIFHQSLSTGSPKVQRL